MVHSLSFDEILPIIGEFNKFQWISQAMYCISQVPVTFPILIMYFAALNPDWKCHAGSKECTMNGTFPPSDSRRCSMNRSAWEYTQPDSYSIVTDFDLACGQEWVVPLTTSIMFVGWIFGALALGWAADNYGRKKVLFPSIFGVLFVGLISAWSPNVWFFTVTRFIVGFFIPATGVNMYVMITEMVGQKYRAASGTTLWGFFTIGLCVMGVKAYLVPHWKTLYIICHAPYLFIIFFWFYVPESIRWLLSRGKVDEATQICQRIAKVNGKVIPDDVVLKGDVVAGVPQKKASLGDLFATKPIVIKTLVLTYNWIVIGLVYYGITLASDDLGGSLYTNYILASVVEFPANVCVVYFCDKFGRKKSVIFTTMPGAIACIIVAFIPLTGNIKILRVTLGLVGKFFVTVAFNSLYAWTVELYGTKIRGNAMGYLQVMSRIGSSSAPWVADGLKLVDERLPFIIMGSLALVSSILAFKLEETKGQEEGASGDGKVYPADSIDDETKTVPMKGIENICVEVDD